MSFSVPRADVIDMIMDDLLTIKIGDLGEVQQQSAKLLQFSVASLHCGEATQNLIGTAAQGGPIRS